MTDEELVGQAQKGEVEAFEELVYRYQKATYFFSLRLVKDAPDAEDLVQKIFLLAFQNIRKFRRASSFKTWLYKISLNQCYNFLRKKKREAGVPIDDLPLKHPGPDQETLLCEREMLVQIRKAVERLPDKQRWVLQLRAYEGLSFEEIGEVLHIRTNAAKVNYHHALEGIKKWVKN